MSCSRSLCASCNAAASDCTSPSEPMQSRSNFGCAEMSAVQNSASVGRFGSHLLRVICLDPIRAHRRRQLRCTARLSQIAASRVRFADDREGSSTAGYQHGAARYPAASLACATPAAVRAHTPSAQRTERRAHTRGRVAHLYSRAPSQLRTVQICKQSASRRCCAHNNRSETCRSLSVQQQKRALN